MTFSFFWGGTDQFALQIYVLCYFFMQCNNISALPWEMPLDQPMGWRWLNGLLKVVWNRNFILLCIPMLLLSTLSFQYFPHFLSCFSYFWIFFKQTNKKLQNAFMLLYHSLAVLVFGLLVLMVGLKHCQFDISCQSLIFLR